MATMRLEDKVRAMRPEILRAAARYGGRNVRVFGSVGRGDSGPDSDIDILVDLPPGHSLLDRIAFEQDLEDLLGARVEVATPASLHPLIREHVLSEAVAV